MPKALDIVVIMSTFAAKCNFIELIIHPSIRFIANSKISQIWCIVGLQKQNASHNASYFFLFSIPQCVKLWYFAIRDKPYRESIYSFLASFLNKYNHRLRKIFNMGGGAQSTASEASRPSACARRSQGSRGLAPWQGYVARQCPLAYENFVFCKLNMHNFRPFLV